MLQDIREKITGPVAWIFLGLIAVVFIFWGIDFQSTAVTYAAKVDGQLISAQEVRRAWQQQQSRLQQMFRAELPEEMVKGQQAQILDTFVRRTLLEQRAEKFGYRVSNEALSRHIHQMPDFQVDGKFQADRYFGLLRSAGLSEPQFEEDLRTSLVIGQLQNGIVDSSFALPFELDRRFQLEKQEREVSYALIAANEFLDDVEVTDEQIQKWYDEHPDEYLRPEKADVQYVELTRARAESRIQVTEEALRDYYEQVKDKYESPERRKARHILITGSDGLDEAAAEKKAADLAAKAKSGADFAQLARENSKDPGSAQEGGDLGWAQRGMFVGPFEDTLFSMKPGDIAGPIKTQFGYHVIKLEEVETGHVRSFEEARAELEADYRAEQAQTIFYEESQKLGDLAFESLTELESVAKALDLPLKTVEGFTREGGGELGNDPGVIEAVFSDDVLQQGQNSPPIPIGDDRAVVVRVQRHIPAERRPLAEVRDEIASRLRIEAARAAAASKGADIVARLNNGESWQQATESAGVSPVEKRFITRQDTVVPRDVVNAAFEVPSNQVSEDAAHYGGVVTADGNYAVFALTQVRYGDPANETPEARGNRRRLAERQLGTEEFEAYLAEAERNADVVKNPRVFE